MKAILVKHARRIIGKTWYIRARIWKIRRKYRHYDHALLDASPKQLGYLSDRLTECAIREKWYKKKLKKEQ